VAPDVPAYYIMGRKEVRRMEYTVELTGLLILFAVAVAGLLFAYMADEERIGREHETWVDWGLAEAALPVRA
jgi:hypothetical protein